jgi:hypothetical protein
MLDGQAGRPDVHSRKTTARELEMNMVGGGLVMAANRILQEKDEKKFFGNDVMRQKLQAALQKKKGEK